jgi:hypothetical protein
MNGRRIASLTAGAALAIAATVVVASSPASGDSPPSEVRMHMTSLTVGSFKYGGATQDLKAQKSSCALTNVAQSIIKISTTGPGNSAAGIANGALGVKGTPSSGNGNPCAQIDATESLTLVAGPTLAGRLFTHVQLDVELAGNAVAELTLSKSGEGGDSETFSLRSGNQIIDDQSEGVEDQPPYLVESPAGDLVDDCAAPNSSGPNSGGTDNCRWTVRPGFLFDTISLTTTDVNTGTVALEGGSDFPNDPTRDTIFFLQQCTTGDVTDTETVVTGTFSRLDGTDCKVYSVEADDGGTISGSDNTILFVPSGGGEVPYRGVINLGPKPAPNGTLNPITLSYDPDGDIGGTSYKPVQWCGSPDFDANGLVTSATMPPNESWCVAKATTTGGEELGTVVTEWQVYGLDDPRFQ